MAGWAFGLDLSGYSSGKSRLAAARLIGDQAEVIILDDAALSRGMAGGVAAQTVQSQEVALLNACLARGPLAVDVPIDLQGLLGRQPVRWLWELTSRPVDKAFGGLPPLADKIGAPVARFAALKAHLSDALGDGLYETYPAASLRLMALTHRGYKPGLCRHENGMWIGCGGSPKSDGVMAELCTNLGIETDCETSDDDLDAAICALTVAADPSDTLRGAALDRMIAERLGEHATSAAGYVLLRRWPVRSMSIRRAPAAEWLTANR